MGGFKLVNYLGKRRITQKILDRYYKFSNVKSINKIDYLITIICSVCNVNVDAIKTHSRKMELVQARQLISYFISKYKLTDTITSGKILGGENKPFDHSTVCFAIKKIKETYDFDKVVKMRVDKINDIIDTHGFIT